MLSFYNQPLAHRFGVTLQQSIRNRSWTGFDVSVAWVRRSGTKHLLPELFDFLKRGNSVRFIVGIDIEGTSKEGLEDLLQLEQAGSIETFIFHNESNVTFHPKLYLFTNATLARLIVASNNITESGLFTNTEAGLQVDVKIDDPLIGDVRSALDSWRDPQQALAHRLNNDLLNDLLSQGYVQPESVLRQRRVQSQGAGKPRQEARRKLFGSVGYSAPPVPQSPFPQSPATPAPATPAPATPAPATPAPATPAPATPIASTVGQVLLMRVRTARGTQVQIPKRIYRTQFFTDINSVRNIHTNRVYPISPTRPERDGGEINTLKLEMPETRGMTEPVVRFERSATEMSYQIFDAQNSAAGQQIMATLEAGRHTQPPETFLALPGDPEHSTWCRFI